MIQYLYENSRLGAAMTANVITYRGRSAACEEAKTLGLMWRRFPDWRNSRRIGAIRMIKTPRRPFSPGGHRYRASLRTEILYALSGHRTCRGISPALRQHGDLRRKVDSIVPLQPATMPNRVVVQDKEDCADMKIIKDLLGLGMMAVLEESIQLIRQHHHEEVDPGYSSWDDPKVYDPTGG